MYEYSLKWLIFEIYTNFVIVSIQDTYRTLKKFWFQLEIIKLY